jgi:hypothetical protein
VGCYCCQTWCACMFINLVFDLVTHLLLSILIVYCVRGYLSLTMETDQLAAYPFIRLNHHKIAILVAIEKRVFFRVPPGFQPICECRHRRIRSLTDTVARSPRSYYNTFVKVLDVM